jgi:hypothetical protein
MAHILPHWTWPERAGHVTPVHVFTSGDEAELFLNGRSLGRKKKGPYEYRLRWDEVVYEPGTLEVVAYKDGKRWATDRVRTAQAAGRLEALPDRAAIRADGRDLSFVTVRVVDVAGVVVPGASHRIKFTVDGPGEIVATDNGDPTSFEPFPSPERNAFSGLCLAIVRAKAGQPGRIRVTAFSEGLGVGTAVITAAGARWTTSRCPTSRATLAAAPSDPVESAIASWSDLCSRMNGTIPRSRSSIAPAQSTGTFFATVLAFVSNQRSICRILENLGLRPSKPDTASTGLQQRRKRLARSPRRPPGPSFPRDAPGGRGDRFAAPLAEPRPAVLEEPRPSPAGAW